MIINLLLDFVNFVNYKVYMNNKNFIKNQANKTINSNQENQNQSDNSGIYLRDDHCDWGSSGMNEFTNEYNSN